MSDLISKQDAIELLTDEVLFCKGIYGDLGGAISGARELIKYMPSVEPEQKKGKWIKIPEFCGDDVSGFVDNHFSCSECKKEAEINSWGFYNLSNFCPHCGARLDWREL